MKAVVRLDKYLADMGAGTRSAVKEAIRRGLVTVNGRTVCAPETKVHIETDAVCCDGRPVSYVSYEYYMLNKPAGVISATQDLRERTVLDLIDAKCRRDLFPVGRLDKDTEGLLLITNDGDLAHRLLSPKKHVSKLYYAKLDGCVDAADVSAFEAGLAVDEQLQALPAHLTILSADKDAHTSEVLVEIHEGKFHQIKRMFEAVGKTVIGLKRLTMGSLHLDERLLPGQYRTLTKEELELLKSGTDAFRKAAEKMCGSDAAAALNAGKSMTLKAAFNGIEAVIFDLDGTLVDSMWMWKDIDIEYLGRFGIAMPDDLQEAIAGISVTQTARYFKTRFGIKDSIGQIIDDWNQMALEKYTYEVPLKSGVREFLKWLKYRHIPCAIATSNSRELTRAVLESHNLNDAFDVILTGEDIHKGKPDPDVYIAAAGRLKLDPKRCLVFEDIPFGIMAAKAAGMRTIAVKDGDSVSDEHQKRSLADGYICDYYDLFCRFYEELKQ